MEEYRPDPPDHDRGRNHEKNPDDLSFGAVPDMTFTKITYNAGLDDALFKMAK
jgi:hypothetical protein